MHFLSQVLHWFTASAHWHGADGIPRRLYEHVSLSAEASLVAAAVALPIGIGLGHLGKGGPLAVNITNVGRAVPSFAVLVISVQLFGIGTTPAFIALFALAVPPMVTNSYTGMVGVDDELVDAARGMGLTGRQILFRVELPVAIPLVMAGVRTATVQVVATRALAALVAAGGLGQYILRGLDSQDNVEVFAGALLVALLSILTEVALALLQRLLTPVGLRSRGTSVKNEPFVGAADALQPS